MDVVELGNEEEEKDAINNEAIRTKRGRKMLTFCPWEV